MADGGGGVRLRGSSSTLALMLRFSMELPQEDPRSSLESVRSLMKLNSLSAVGLLPASSISTLITGGGACLGSGGMPALWAVVLAG